VIDVAAERFEALVAEAIDSIPEELARGMDNVVIRVVDEPRPELLGLYEGIPLTHRDQYGGMVLPDQISIYRQSILAYARDEDDLVRMVRTTVIHEIAHHFGISDARLRELGWASTASSSAMTSTSVVWAKSSYA
jgi:predicted Zn-dependent protease with MMP-like domain